MTNPIITKAPVDPEGKLDKYLGICEQLKVFEPWHCLARKKIPAPVEQLTFGYDEIYLSLGNSIYRGSSILVIKD